MENRYKTQEKLTKNGLLSPQKAPIWHPPRKKMYDGWDHRFHFDSENEV